LLFVNILGHRGRLVLAHFFSFVTARLARGVDVIANQFGDWTALLVGDHRNVVVR